jgi:ATP-binding cassette, subfamily B, bacterial HlyB/CyaB
MDRADLMRDTPTSPNSRPSPPSSIDSGLWALAVIAQQQGVQLDGLLLAHQLALAGRKAANDDLLRLAIDSGFKAELLADLDEARLDSMPRPAILRLKSDRYVILGPRNPLGSDIYDAGVPHPARRTNEELSREWTGEAILIRHDATAGRTDPVGFGLQWFIPTIMRHRRTLFHIVIASICLQICAMAAPLFVQVIIDKVVVHNTFATLIVVTIALVLSGTFEIILQQLRTHAVLHTGNRLDLAFGRRLFNHVLNLPLGYFEANPTGQIIERVRQIEPIRAFFTGQALTSLIDIVFALVFIALLASYSLALTLIVVVTISLYVLLAALVRPQLRERSRIAFGTGAEKGQFLFESISGMGTLKAGAAESSLRSQWDHRLAMHVQATFNGELLGKLLQNTSQWIGKISTACILFLGATMVIAGEMTIGQLIAFNMLAGLVAAPVLRLSALWQDFQQVQVSVARVREIMDTPAESPSNVLTNLPPMRGAIRFRNVDFRYFSTTPDVLHDIDLDIPAGQVIGIVGPSGSGKSTLTKLVQRLYLPQRGHITIDGIDTARMHPVWLRQQIGVVLQENLLFSKTIHENIALAAPYLSRDQVIRLAQQVGADEFISKMPSGYDTRIVERGANLSGGERQRLAIARALARDPRILILDEATSAVDYESERIIQSQLQEIAQGRTVIIIAHRLAAVRCCDRIIGIVDGRVHEDGSHEELLRRPNGVYRRLWNLQSLSHDGK